MKIAGCIAVVTGASAGLGRATASALARRGAHVVLVARRAAELEAAAAEVRAHGVRALAVPCDVSDGEAVRAAHARAEAELGPIDILVNAAGYAVWRPFALVPEAEHRRMMEVNYWGAFHWICACLPGMRGRGRGHLVNVSAGTGKVAFAVTSGYSASKFALTGLSEALHRELQGSGVGLTCLHPGSIATEFWDEQRAPAAGLPQLVRWSPRLPPEAVARTLCRCIRLGLPAWTTPVFVVPLIKANHAWIRLGDFMLSRWFLPAAGALLAGRLVLRAAGL
jgi:short-subunit dehydrogenase